MKSPTSAAINRVPWIDICRGFGITLVLYGHLITLESQRYLIYAFHMPLFFFLSGLVFKPVHNKTMQSIVVKNFKQLLIPYFFFAVFTYLFAVLTNPKPDLTPGGIAWQLFGILYGSGSDGMLGFNVVLWFLPCLFITRLTFALITRRVTQTKILGLILLLFGTIGYTLSILTPWIKLPFGLEIALTGIVFFGLGYLWKTRKYALAALRPYRLFIALLAIGITYFAATANYHIGGNQIDLRANRYNNVFLFYTASLGGILALTMISQLIRANKVLEYIGRNSMVIFAWHNLLIVNLQTIISTLVSDDFIRSIQFFLPTFYVLVVTTVILILRKILLILKTATRVLAL